ncbi:MAG: peptide chain release factor N(5)-glutamine methyltransferase [Actinomycetota bacterium]
MADTSDPTGYDPSGSTVAWRSFHREATTRLAAAGVDAPDVDARRIVEAASGFEGAEFHLGLDRLATKRGVVRFDDMMERRLAGEPLQYVVGSWGFRTLDLMVDRRVLIPRPETEVVAGLALAELARLAEPGHVLTAVDLGTGSGAIGLSLAAERTDTHVVLTDASEDALQVARANLTGIGRAATRVMIRQGSWFEALAPDLAGRVDVVVSNPPYVAESDPLPSVVADWEPLEALRAPDGGRADLRHLIGGVGEWLRPGGSLVLEMDPTQTAWAAEAAAAAGLVDISIRPDLSGRDRALTARRPA